WNCSRACRRLAFCWRRPCLALQRSLRQLALPFSLCCRNGPRDVAFCLGAWAGQPTTRTQSRSASLDDLRRFRFCYRSRLLLDCRLVEKTAGLQPAQAFFGPGMTIRQADSMAAFLVN